MLVSILIPFYNEEEQFNVTLAAVHDVMRTSCSNYDYEIVALDDGSCDNTWSCMRLAAANDPRLRALHFSRNFGKEAAIIALLDYAAGDCVILMDGDLQHPPRFIPEMLRLWHEEAYEIVDGVKNERQKESFAARSSANLFYKLFKKVCHLDLYNASDFKLLDRKAVEAFKRCPERDTFFRALSCWIGFKRCDMPFDVDERQHGHSKWSPWGLLKLSTKAFVSFSSAPLVVIMLSGWVFLIFAVVLGIQTLVRFFMGLSADGFTTVILLLLLIGGCTLLSLGLIGTYIARIYTEIKGRPRYIVSDDTAAGKQSVD